MSLTAEEEGEGGWAGPQGDLELGRANNDEGDLVLDNEDLVLG